MEIRLDGSYAKEVSESRVQMQLRVAFVLISLWDGWLNCDHGCGWPPPDELTGMNDAFVEDENCPRAGSWYRGTECGFSERGDSAQRSDSYYGMTAPNGAARVICALDNGDRSSLSLRDRKSVV